MSNESVEIGRLYLPIKQIADAIDPKRRELFVNLPGLRGYWPMSAVDWLGNAKDHSGASSDLSRAGAPVFGYDGNGYIQCGVGNDYLTGSIGAQQITGTEAWILAGIRGLTVGCWLNLDTLPSTTEGLAGRWFASPNRSYMLGMVSPGSPRFLASGDGTAAVFATGNAIITGSWVFLVGRFTPSGEVAIFVDGVKTVNTSSVPASLHAGTAVFEAGRLDGNDANIVHGKIRDVFLCSSVLGDSLIEEVRLASLPS